MAAVAAVAATAAASNEVSFKEAESCENGKYETDKEVNLVPEEVTQTEKPESKPEGMPDKEDSVDEKPAEATPGSPLTKPVFVLKYKYADDQWSPLNKSGKKCYDIGLLMQIKEDPLSQIKPNVAPLLKAWNVFRLMDAGPVGSGEGDSRGRHSFMDNAWKTPRTTTYPVDMSKQMQVTQKSLNNMKLSPHHLRAHRDMTPAYHYKGASIDTTFKSRGDFTSGGGRSGSVGVARWNRSQGRALSTPLPAPAPSTSSTPQEPISDEKMRNSVKSTIDLCLINTDNDELVTEVKQLFPPQYHAAVVRETLTIVLKKAPKQVALVAKSLLHLVSTNTIVAENFLAGLKESFEYAPATYTYLRIPMLYDNLAILVAPQIEKKHITLVQTFNLSNSIIAADHGHLLLKAIISHLNVSMGPAFVTSKWQESGLQLSKWMNEDQVTEWIKGNKFEFLEGGANATAPPQEPITDDKMRNSVKCMIDLCLMNTDNDELVTDVKQLFPSRYHAAVVSEILNVVLEMAPKQVALVAKSLLYLVCTSTISAENFLAGLKETFEYAPDLNIYIPMFYDYLAKFVAPQIEKKHITLVQTFNLSKSIIASHQGHLLLKAIINHLNVSMGPAFVKSKWQESGLQLKEWMNEDQVAEWIEDNKFEFLGGGVNATTPLQEPITDEKMRKSVKSTIDLCLINTDNDELVTDVKQLFPPQYHAAVVREIIDVVLEKAPKQVALVAKSLLYLVYTSTISAENFLAGLKETFEYAPDLYIDIPMLYDYIAILVAPQIETKHITLVQTFNLSNSIIAADHGHLLLKAIISHLNVSMGPAFVKSKWQESGLLLCKWMNEDQVAEWIEDNKFEFLGGGVNATTPLQEPITDEKMRKSVKSTIDLCLIDNELVADVKQLFPPQYLKFELLEGGVKASEESKKILTPAECQSRLHQIETITKIDNETEEHDSEKSISIVADDRDTQDEAPAETITKTDNETEEHDSEKSICTVADDRDTQDKASAETITKTVNETEENDNEKSICTVADDRDTQDEAPTETITKADNETEEHDSEKSISIVADDRDTQDEAPAETITKTDNETEEHDSEKSICTVADDRDTQDKASAETITKTVNETEENDNEKSICTVADDRDTQDEAPTETITKADNETEEHDSEKCISIVADDRDTQDEAPAETITKTDNETEEHDSEKSICTVADDRDTQDKASAETITKTVNETEENDNEKSICTVADDRDTQDEAPTETITKADNETEEHDSEKSISIVADDWDTQDEAPAETITKTNNETEEHDSEKSICMVADDRDTQDKASAETITKTDNETQEHDDEKSKCILTYDRDTQDEAHAEIITKTDDKTEEHDNEKSVNIVADDRDTQDEAASASSKMPGKNAKFDEKNTQTEPSRKFTRKVQNEFEIFGMHVTSQLRLLSAKQAILAQLEIQSILTQGRLRDLEADVGDCCKTRNNLENVSDVSAESFKDDLLNERQYF